MTSCYEQALENLDIVILCIKYNFCAKYVKTEDSNLQTKFGVHIISNIFEIIKFFIYLFID